MLLLQVLTSRNENFGFAQRLEWMTFDWRARQAQQQPSPYAPNLGFVSINDETIERVLSGQFGYQAGLYWPRHVYGRIIQELRAQGAEVIAFDVLFAELRPDHPPATLPDGTEESSDYFFARQLREAGNVVLAAVHQTVPPDFFRTNAWAIADIDTRPDNDGILRRIKAFEDYTIWHPTLLQLANSLDGFSFNTNRVVWTATNGARMEIPIAADGTFDIGTLMELVGGRKLPPTVERTSFAFSRYRAWDLGITAAAHYLKLDLTRALIEPGRRIVLHGANGVERAIPIDAENRFYIDWSLTYGDRRRLTQESAHSLLDQQRQRELGRTNDLTHLWHNKIALIGSIATGNDLTDMGATPLEKQTFLTGRYWNIANALIIGRFIQQPGLAVQLALILSLSLIAGILTWNLRTLVAAICVVLLAAAYVSAALFLYVEARYWLPLVLPGSALFLSHIALVSYRAVFEQRERRRIRSIFAKIVSPNVVTELLRAEKLSLVGVRREVTVFFSDVRGFTEMTDESHARAEEFVRERKLAGAQAESYFDEQAQEILRTVNLYLGTIADTIKQHEGTLDKYIGDCVMAFWGAPTPSDNHALSCVRAAIDAQRAIHALNQVRAAENTRREEENQQRIRAGHPPLPMLKLLAMGSGINTGIVTVGLMGSERHTFNYTVFGRDVNLASRLEGLSGRSRILIGEATYRALLRDDPALAANCQELTPAMVKGFRTAVKIFEVRWRADATDTSSAPKPSIATSTEPAH
jgi:class 3 adenylate cyclase/CHASE2 domain-containing sensor protein